MDAITPPSIKERPIVLKAHEVHAILEGRKSQMRRLAKIPDYAKGTVAPQELRGEPKKHPAPYFDAYCGQRLTPHNPRGMSDNWCWWDEYDRQCNGWVKCLYGQPGDRLWVRETSQCCYGSASATENKIGVMYAAGGTRIFDVTENFNRLWYPKRAFTKMGGSKWTPSIHMPRWASRITLEIVSVRVERLQDISEDDAFAEGVECWQEGNDKPTYRIEEFCSFTSPVNAYRGLKAEDWPQNPWVWVLEFKRVDAA